MILFKFPGIEKVRCLFCGRDGSPGQIPDGDFSITGANAAANRSTLAVWLGKAGCQSWAEARQAHGCNVLVDPAPTAFLAKPETLAEADGICTDRAGQALIIKTADCQPWLLAHKSGRYIMALHAGWRGNRQSFPQKAVGNFCDRYNIQPEDIFACRGPSLGPANARFENFAREWGSEYLTWFNRETRCMDLWKLGRQQFMEAGLREDHIFGLDICTFENAHAWFSYRRNKESGRQASLIWIENSCGENAAP